MKGFLVVAACALVLVGCNRREPAETVESLVANPERLKALRAQCKADHGSVGEAQCGAVAEATRRRFMGSGTPYAPTPAAATAPAPTPASASAASASLAN